jgi:hypothetical protein
VVGRDGGIAAPSGAVAGWARLGIGGCTLLVAILKIFDPRNP